MSIAPRDEKPLQLLWAPWLLTDVCNDADIKSIKLIELIKLIEVLSATAADMFVVV